MHRLIVALLSLFIIATVGRGQTLEETFSDGDLLKSPVWSGNLTEFEQNTANQLQLIADKDSSPVYLSTSATWNDTCSWELWVRTNTKTSASVNYVQIFLSSNSADLSNDVDGYYIKIGENGNADGLLFYKQSGQAKMKLGEGRDSTMGNPNGNNYLRLRVTRSKKGEWIFSTDTTGGNQFVEEFRVTDNTYSSGAHFGVLVNYSSANTDKFFFDDIKVAPLFEDKTAPSITRVKVLDNQNIELTFDEDLDSLSAVDLANYTIDGKNISSSAFPSSAKNVVQLKSSFVFVSGTTYGVNVNGVKDLAGNPIVNASETFQFQQAEKGDIRITEIFADPTPKIGLPQAEFVELYNTTSSSVNLEGWKFADATNDVVLPAYTLAGNSYVILCPTASEPDYESFGETIGVSLPSLNNSGDALSIESSDGTIIDAVDYKVSWYNDDVKDNGGYSLELINLQLKCSGQANWIASNSASGGTPGKVNSVNNNKPDVSAPAPSVVILRDNELILGFNEVLDSQNVKASLFEVPGLETISKIEIQSGSLDTIKLTLTNSLKDNKFYNLKIQGLEDCEGNITDTLLQNAFRRVALRSYNQGDVVINEIFADPNPQIGLPESEYIELYNTTAGDIELEGWTFSDATATGSMSVFTLKPSSYLILCNASSEDDFKVLGDVSVISLPSLNNGGDDLLLKDGKGNVIDQLTYDASWYEDNAKSGGGYSLERRNPTLKCSSSANWTASRDASGGTPGKVNSVFSAIPDSDAPVLLDATVLSGDTILLQFDEPLDSVSTANAEYSIPGIGTAKEVLVPDFPHNQIRLVLSTTLGSNTLYDLQVKGVADCEGNAVDQTFQDLLIYLIPEPAEMFDILIHEIFADPDPTKGLPESEYLELYNRSDHPISLKDWKLKAGNDVVTFPDYIMNSGSFLIVTTSSAAASFEAYGNVLSVSGFPGLNNGGELIKLRNAEDDLIHFVEYSDNWYGDEIKEDGGYSLEMIDAQNPCGRSDNWAGAERSVFGTPGQANSVEGANPDQTAPLLQNVLIDDNGGVRVFFNESLDSTSLLNADNYQITGEAIIWTSTQSTGELLDAVALETSNSFEENVIYELEVYGITDCVGNTIGDAVTLEFAIASDIDSFDVAINEILFNPYKNGSDFIELVNRSDKFIDLGDLQLTNISDDGNYGTRYTIAEEGRLLFPGEYVAISTDLEFLKDNYTVKYSERLFEMESLPSMSDSEGEVVLITTDSQLVDQFVYEDDFHFQLLKDDEGVSLERLNLNATTQDEKNWHSASSSSGYATPGYVNSQQLNELPGNNVVNLSGESFSPDGDGFEDLLQISIKADDNNQSVTMEVYSLMGVMVKQLVDHDILGSESNYTWDGITDNGAKAPIGPYILLVQIVNLDGSVDKIKKPFAVVTRF